MTTSVAPSLAALAAFSARIGSDRLFVQGAGGNTSLKHDGRLWVKASGTWLANAEREAIFVDVPLAEVRALLRESDGESRLVRLAPPGGLRPSIETSLHALLPHPVVAHVHSVDAIAWAVRDDARTALAARLEGLRWAFVPYRRPGQPLTRAVTDALRDHEGTPDVLLLANHGLVVGAPDCDAAEALLHEVRRRLVLPQRVPSAPDRERLTAVDDMGWVIAGSEIVHGIASDAIACAVAARGALYPDHAVFLGEHACIVDDGEALSQALTRMPTAVYAIVPHAGVLVSPTITSAALAMLDCFALVALRIADADELAYLGDDDVAALLGWEAEAYRQARDRARSPS
jgi:rhamnose utilization protein RhaD (predicted bifunctional aldolase and dehydrogenase)